MVRRIYCREADHALGGAVYDRFFKVFDSTTGKLDSNAMEKNGKYPFFTCSQETFKINNDAFDSKIYGIINSSKNIFKSSSEKEYLFIING